MKGRPKLTPDMLRRLKALDELPDDRIDTSDIAERPDDNRSLYVNLIPVPGTPKKSVTIRLDKDMVDWFRKQGKGWQTKMNWALRLYFASHRKTGAKVGRP
ncbi:MAG TPA: BrnA antitoxin family protein [Rhizomicrobium sp.]|nr:BrnA antitoxin family protein [Rhizomicrobium sp.]